MAPFLAASLLTLALAAQRPAQLPQLQDPANLTGERVSPQDPADTLPLNHGTPALQQLLLKLRTRASFMLIVAHPDDEDGGLLTYLSRGQGARVAMLTLNRGEGGQNLMSADFDDALGLIRTQELLAADRYMGVDQFFGTEVDFGFSKTKEEAFSKWTHDRVLYDAVRAVRLYRPLVIASVFIGGPSDGHGQHQVAGQIAQEVFNAAGDPKVFPDQIAEGLEPWQPLKVYARVPNARIVTDASGAQSIYDYATNQYTPARFTNYVTGRVTTTIPPANVVIPEGDPATYTPPDGTKTSIPGMEGLSYAQFAAKGRSLQKTQFGANARQATPGPHDVAYTLYGSKLPCPVQIKQPASTPARQPLLGTPSLQARVSTSPAANGALAPGACPPSTEEPSLFSGIDTSLPGIADLVPEASDKLRPLLEKIDAQIVEAQTLFNPAKPELIAPPLRLALATLDQLLHELEDPNINDLPSDETYSLLHELRIKRVQLNNALVLAEGIALTASVTSPTKPEAPLSNLLTSQTTAELHLDIMSSAASPIRLISAAISSPAQEQTIFADKPTAILPAPYSMVHALTFPGGLPATRPYFSRQDVEQPFYDLSNRALRNAPATPAPFAASISLDDSGTPLTLVAAVTGADARQAIAVVPVDSVSFSHSAGVLPIGKTDSMAWVESRIPISTCTGHIYDQPGVCGHYASESSIHLDLPPGWNISDTAKAYVPRDLTLTQYVGFTLAPPALHSGDKLAATASAEFQGRSYAEGYRPVGYPGLTTTNYFRPATYRATAVDLHLPDRLLVGYIKGTGDEVYDSLFQLLGGNVQMVGLDELTAANLKRFDAIILGVRAYESRPQLAAANSVLSTYVANGGVVIVQYAGRDLPVGSAPYSLSLGSDEKVVEEDAPVQILEPTNPLLTWPNKITSADFDHWIEERGHGFMATWDPRYTALVETHDHGQQPQHGGLLVARTGKGAWIYLGLALYRQLPEGVPGAYRILANLVSAAKNPSLRPTEAPTRSPAQVTK